MPQSVDDRIVKLNENLRYLTRVVSALCKNNQGELRVPYEMIDCPGDATQIQFLRDRKSQELIIRTAKENELPLKTFAVTPENTTPQSVTAAAPQPDAQGELPLTPKTHGNVLDSPNLEALHSKLKQREVVRLLNDELKANRRTQTQ
jgi:hypothetical protein